MTETMLAVVVPKYTTPDGYQLSTVPRPTIDGPTDVICRVHAASVNPVDVKIAAGATRMALPETFPTRIGYDCAGVVTAVGSAVTGLNVGDEVWSRLPEVGKGAWAEYVKCPASYVALKPSKLSYSEAASLPLAGLTAMQALRRYRGSLAGKTVFITAGLSGTGAYACQLAKNVFGAGKVITTVSTTKIDKIPEYLGENVVDQIIDYTKHDPRTVIPAGSVDFFLDTMGDAMAYLSLMTPSTSTIISISTTPSGAQFQEASFFQRPDRPRIPWYAHAFLDASDWIRRVRARRWGVEYRYMFLAADAQQLDLLRGFVDAGQIRAVIGSRTALRDIEQVREVCRQAYEGKGGLGKAVFEMMVE